VDVERMNCCGAICCVLC